MNNDCNKFLNYFFEYTEKVYNETLASVKQSFPQYISELQGIADGAQIEFYKVTLIAFYVSKQN